MTAMLSLPILTQEILSEILVGDCLEFAIWPVGHNDASKVSTRLEA